MTADSEATATRYSEVVLDLVQTSSISDRSVILNANHRFPGSLNSTNLPLATSDVGRHQKQHGGLKTGTGYNRVVA
jgi:hypothetical protein